MTTTLSSKGQIVIPNEVREQKNRFSLETNWKHEFHTSAYARNAAFMRQQTPEPKNGAQNNCRVRNRFTFLPDESGVPLQFQLNRSGLTWKKGEIRVKRS
ncbi:MAG: AbrB/MazE/SpoVT family DNA-binding domain-containing protein [Verrucomicrobia bacterium]|nr:AbrB/MazE/SpoVT family DNA-binding domain-containing protein [Verrucomicrobiota bacterium]